ncbi:MAG: hypothetical protein GX331_11175 [Firmicutes bacterium]|nr:hypothetical protein [Bacillota bacterium]
MWSKESQETYEMLKEAVLDIALKWQFYRAYYVGDPMRVDLLNKIAPITFGLFQAVLIDDIVLSINRLLDSPQMMRNENLVLERLITSIRNDGFNDLADDQEKQLAKIKGAAQNLRVRRHKKISHNDLATFTATSRTLPPVTIESISDVLEHIYSFLNSILLFFEEKTLYYEFLDSGGNEPARFTSRLGTIVD